MKILTEIFKHNLIKSNCLILLFFLTQSCTSQIVDKDIAINLSEWKAVNPENQHFWTITDSTIIGGNRQQKMPVNTYLRSKKAYKNFELRCLFRLTGDHDLGLINSGIQYRSIVEKGKISGYQADIGKGYWGDIYDEHRRGKLIDGNLSVLKQLLNEDGWNSYIVRCKGDIHELYINGVKTTEYKEIDKNIPSEGVIAFQLHEGGNAMLEIKNITITEL